MEETASTRSPMTVTTVPRLPTTDITVNLVTGTVTGSLTGTDTLVSIEAIETANGNDTIIGE